MNEKISVHSKEAIKARMMQNAVRIWGLKSTSSIDPFVRLLMEAFSTELYRANNEVHTVNVRILERLAKLLTPSMYTYPQPAHAIAATVPMEAKTSDGTIKKYQAMADYKGVIGYGSGKISNAIPEFDVWKGKVTDAQFRIDLPMLMLWLDRHKPTIKDKNSPFYGKVDKNGFLLEDYKEKIRPYEAK